MHNHKKEIIRTIMTLYGKLSIRRTLLYSKKDKASVLPKDEYLCIDTLPFKVTIPAMNMISYIDQNQISFKEASEILKEHMNIDLIADIVRKVTEYVGAAVYDNDTNMAEEQYKDIANMDFENEGNNDI